MNITSGISCAFKLRETWEISYIKLEVLVVYRCISVVELCSLSLSNEAIEGQCGTIEIYSFSQSDAWSIVCDGTVLT